MGRAAFHQEDPRAPALRRRCDAAEIELRYKKRSLSQRSNEDARTTGWVMDEHEIIDPLLNVAVLSRQEQQARRSGRPTPCPGSRAIDDDGRVAVN